MMGKSLTYAYPQKFAEGGEVPSGVEVPEGFEFAGMVDSKYQGPVASFTKVGDDTGFTIYAAENQFGKNKGKTGYYFDDVGDEAGSAGTGGYLDANDAFNQGRSRSNNYVHHYNTLIDRGVELDDAAMEQLNAALAHHDKYLGGQESYASNRSNIIDAMNNVANYDNFTGQIYSIGNDGARSLRDFADTFTTMAVGEEDGGLPINGKLPNVGDTFTTAAMGEEDGGLPINDVTTQAWGEEDSSPAPFDPVYTTMAMGEEDGGGGMGGSDGFPVPTPRPENPFLGMPVPADPPTIAPPSVLPPTFENPFDNRNIKDLNPIATTMAMGEEDGGMPSLPPPTTTLPRTYGTTTPGVYQPPGQPRSYGGGDFQGTGTPFTYQAPDMTLPAPVDGNQNMAPLREGIGALFDRAKSLQGQTNYVNPFLRTGG
jgi:hypothetical protein